MPHTTSCASGSLLYQILSGVRRLKALAPPDVVAIHKAPHVCSLAELDVHFSYCRPYSPCNRLSSASGAPVKRKTSISKPTLRADAVINIRIVLSEGGATSYKPIRPKTTKIMAANHLTARSGMFFPITMPTMIPKASATNMPEVAPSHICIICPYREARVTVASCVLSPISAKTTKASDAQCPPEDSCGLTPGTRHLFSTGVAPKPNPGAVWHSYTRGPLPRSRRPSVERSGPLSCTERGTSSGFCRARGGRGTCEAGCGFAGRVPTQWVAGDASPHDRSVEDVEEALKS